LSMSSPINWSRRISRQMISITIVIWENEATFGTFSWANPTIRQLKNLITKKISLNLNPFSLTRVSSPESKTKTTCSLAANRMVPRICSPFTVDAVSRNLEELCNSSNVIEVPSF
jgi:hypothetical protein